MILAYLVTIAVIGWLCFSIWYLFRTWREVKSGQPIISEEHARLMAKDHRSHH